MKIGVFDPVFGAVELEPMLDRIVELGIEAVEIGAGNYPGDRHCKPADAARRCATRASDSARPSSSRGLAISALSCHGNPMHPDPDRAAARRWRLPRHGAAGGELGIGVVNLFSGCPGDGPKATQPNWVTCAWPPEFGEIVAWQWDEVVLPYWQTAGAFAREHGMRLGIRDASRASSSTTRRRCCACGSTSAT